MGWLEDHQNESTNYAWLEDEPETWPEVLYDPDLAYLDTLDDEPDYDSAEGDYDYLSEKDYDDWADRDAHQDWARYGW